MFRETDVAHLVPDHDEPVGIDIGQRTNEYRIDCAEHRRVDADAERQRRDGDGRKRRIAADLTQSVTDIPRDLVQPGAAASGSDAFFRLLHAAKLEYGHAARVAWRHPVAHPVGEGHVDKGLQLVIQILLDSVPMNQPAYD